MELLVLFLGIDLSMIIEHTLLYSADQEQQMVRHSKNGPSRGSFALQPREFLMFRS